MRCIKEYLRAVKRLLVHHVVWLLPCFYAGIDFWIMVSREGTASKILFPFILLREGSFLMFARFEAGSVLWMRSIRLHFVK